VGFLYWFEKSPYEFQHDGMSTSDVKKAQFRAVCGAIQAIIFLHGEAGLRELLQLEEVRCAIQEKRKREVLHGSDHQDDSQAGERAAREFMEQHDATRFVRDYSRGLLGRNVPELEGLVSRQVDQMKKSAHWQSLRFSDEPEAAFREAQALADQGKLVVVSWKDPHPKDVVSGHVAVVVPLRGQDKDLHLCSRWNMRVPYIAQVRHEEPCNGWNQVRHDYVPLGEGFSTDQQEGMDLFVLTET
jgi:hypothetical protein